MKNPLRKKILFLKVKSRDPEAYGQFYDLYVSRIYRFIFFKVNSSADAQDLTSEVFLKLWYYIREGREIKNLNAFVYMVARNAVIDFYRQNQRRRQEYSLDNPKTPELADKKTIGASQNFDFQLEELKAGLKGLKDEYREVIVLRFLDGLGISEIAEILNKSQGAVRVLIHRALKALKENISNLA